MSVAVTGASFTDRVPDELGIATSIFGPVGWMASAIVDEGIVVGDATTVLRIASDRDPAASSMGASVAAVDVRGVSTFTLESATFADPFSGAADCKGPAVARCSIVVGVGAVSAAFNFVIEFAISIFGASPARSGAAGRMFAGDTGTSRGGRGESIGPTSGETTCGRAVGKKGTGVGIASAIGCSDAVFFVSADGASIFGCASAWESARGVSMRASIASPLSRSLDGAIALAVGIAA